MTDLVKRALHAHPELAYELYRRGLFEADEKKEFLAVRNPRLPHLRLGPVQFATLLAEGDSQLAARVVLRGLMRPKELPWLYRLLKFQPRTDKREELTRIVERALEGRMGHGRTAR